MTITGRGVRAVEQALLAGIDRLVAESEREPRLLALPVRVIVPSRSLKAHLAATLVRRRGRAVAGVVLQTLFGVASEVCDRAGIEVRRSTALFEVLVRRLAPREPILAAELGHLEDGFAGVASTLRDLFDAGFARDQAKALAARLAGARAGRERERDRGQALVRLAAAVGREMEVHGYGLRAHLLETARAALARDAARVLPARAVYIHGFADASGTATGFLTALVTHRDAVVLLDRPPDPAEPLREDPGVAFSTRFSAEIERAGRAATATLAAEEIAAAPPAELTLVRAPGSHAEMREVAERIHRLLALGTEPERIGVVARELAPLALPIRLHFGRLGVPFSAIGATGPSGAEGRAAAALADLLLRQGEVAAERWLEAQAGGPIADLRIALATLGAGQLADVAALELSHCLGPRGDFPLPLRLGFQRSDEDEDEGDGEGASEGVGDGASEGAEVTTIAARRSLPGAQLARCIEDARRLVERLARGAAPARAAEHLARIRRILTEDLHWREDSAVARGVLHVLATLEAELPAELVLARDEVLLLLLPSLREIGREALGGAGGGVAVLGVIEARGRTFEHLFVVGLNRDVFPRAVREDPLLPDALRELLASALPALPRKLEPGIDEEHFLFAQLVSAAPSVTLSWAWTDDDGKPLQPSPLVERIRLSGRVAAIEDAPHPLAAPVAFGAERVLTVEEQAIRAGLGGDRRRFGALLPAALAATRSGEVEVLARARLAVLEEQDPDLSSRAGRATRATLGPYFGFVGTPDSAGALADLRASPLYVTQLESLARCPWRHLLTGLLRLEALPDPLAELPAITTREVGILVHAVLHQIVLDALPHPPATLALALAREPVQVPWPSPSRLAEILRAKSLAVLREAGIGWTGLSEVLAARARPRLELARSTDWPEPGSTVPVIGAEIEGEVELVDARDGEGGRRRLRFRADRVDRLGKTIRLVDYKAGRSKSAWARDDTRRKHLLADIDAGRRLQAAVYALAADPAEGRFLFLSPDAGDDVREIAIASADQGARSALEGASAMLLRARELGTFLPRFLDPAGGGRKDQRCSDCDVQIACLRGDSGARRRLAEQMQSLVLQRDRGETLDPVAASLLALGSLCD